MLTLVQIPDAGVCIIPSTDDRVRGDSADGAAPGAVAAVGGATLLVGAVRRGMGGHVECMWVHHAAVPRTRG